MTFNNKIDQDDLYYAISKCSTKLSEMEKIIGLSSISDIGEFSDGYHTFNELYHHRAILFSLFCNQNPAICWKSKKHNPVDNEMYEGMFIVGAFTPFGQISYHYNLEKYWDLFKVKELECAPKWDHHTPEDVANRLLNFSILLGENNMK